MSKPNANPTALRRILQQHLQLSRRIVSLTEQQSEALIAGNVSYLSALEAELRDCLAEQETLESARMAACRALAWSFGLERVPTLSGLLPHLPPREQQALLQIRDEMIVVQDELNTLKSRNLYLLENALDYVRFSLDVLTHAVIQPARYGTNLTHIATPAFYVDSKA